MNTITPSGFIEEFLHKQTDGLTGHIEVAGFPFGKVEWGKPDVFANDGKPNWWVYEQTAYWLDGFTRAAILLNDEKALARAKRIIYNVLEDDEEGYLGPKQLKEAIGEDDRWPHVVFFRACMALYEYEKDEKIVRAMTRHYLDCPCDFARGRNVLNVEIMCWLYNKTGEQRLIKLAEETYAAYNLRCKDDLCDKVALSSKKPRSHGVGYNEYSKLGAILYLYTGKKEYLQASVCAYKKIDKYFMLPDGLHASNEFMISDNVTESHETCCVTDYTWSLHYLFEATKDSKYLDKIEKCIFNAGLGAVTDDFKALQYLSCVNQVIIDNHSNHNLYWKGEKWMTYRPRPAVACCTGNVNRFMPNYAMHMFSQEGNTVRVKLYGACVFRGEGVTIEEKTDYPFKDVVVFDVKTEKEITLLLRIPSWSEAFSLVVDGEKVDKKEENGFVSITLTKNSEIVLTFANLPKRHRKRNAVWFSKGALVYTLAVEHEKKKDETDENTREDFPAWEIYPTGKWNYGVKDDAEISVDEEGNLVVDAYEVKNWKLLHRKSVKRCVLQDQEFETVKGDFTFTPPIPTRCEIGEKTKMKLTPYGFAKCRITAFPKIK